MLKSEEEIRSMYRNYIELWACIKTIEQRDKDVLQGAILAYGRVLGFNALKVYKDQEMAKNKYISI
jgi:hypothetical protein